MHDPRHQQIEALCEVLQDDLDRQEDLLALCKSQGRAILEHDIEMIEARTEAINALMADASETEKRRVALTAMLMQAYNLPRERQTLSGLIEAVPAPWKERMREFQTRMREVLAETREVVRANSNIMRRSVKIVNEALDTLTRCVPQARGHYDARGGDPAAAAKEPAFLDQRG